MGNLHERYPCTKGNDAILGMGAYGLVVKGMLRNPNGAITDVAVKTTKPESTDVTYFKSLLYEVKMMAYLGPHVNIVNLIGAVTTEIRQSNGSLF